MAYEYGQRQPHAAIAAEIPAEPDERKQEGTVRIGILRKRRKYLQPIVTQYLVCNKSEIWP